MPAHAGQAPGAEGAKKGLCGHARGRRSRRGNALAASAARSLARGAGLEAAELAIRAAVLELGRAVLEPLLAANAGYRGPQADCGHGHQGGFVSYRDKTIDTVLGPVTLRRAWYHCAECGHGFAPRNAGLGVTGDTMSPGLARMTDRAAAAVPFGAAAKLVGELAGISLTGERARRRAEADGGSGRADHSGRGCRCRSPPGRPFPAAGPAPDMLYICVDGTGVPVIAAETEGRDGKGEDGKAHTREVKLCCAFTQTAADKDGRCVTPARRPT